MQERANSKYCCPWAANINTRLYRLYLNFLNDLMETTGPKLVKKLAVAERLGVSERTLEKLVRARRFPPPLRIGKNVVWADEAVEKWLVRALATQVAWEPKQRGRVAAV
jgi:predicted DNA-binding transcriptional regulator AlpA